MKGKAITHIDLTLRNLHLNNAVSFTKLEQLFYQKKICAPYTYKTDITTSYLRKDYKRQDIISV